MITTAYGYKVMEAGDLANVWMPAIEDNWTRMSAHNHDGVDSVLLTPDSISKFTSSISHLSWGAPTAGIYSQTITVPAAVLEVNDYELYTYITSTGERIYPSITRASATTFTIAVNDNTIDLTVRYG